VFEGRPQISRRYAIDWMQVKNGALFSGDERDSRSYYSYGKDVLAVADGEVVSARDGLPDNVPGHNENFHPAIPITPEPSRVTPSPSIWRTGSSPTTRTCNRAVSG